jgi:RNA polymerase primary sigma factor
LAQGTRLSAEQERDLVVATEGGDRVAGRQLVESFLPAIAGVARRYRSDVQLQHRELMQEGIAALLFAAQRYDPSLGTPFWGYASFWVRKAMQELVAEVTRPVALSDHAVRGLAQIKGARQHHLRAHGSEPTRAELAAATGFTGEQVDSLLATDRTARSLEEALDAETGTTATFGESIADPGAELEYEHVLDAIEVRDLTCQLDEREHAVLSGHYGLGQPPKTLNEIGATLGLSAERVRQIEANALEKLRELAAQPPTPSG